MERINSYLPSIEDISNSMKRCTQSYSFGTKEECKELFFRAFVGTDGTVKQFTWLPEYEKVIDWMSDTQGKGLLLSGPCGIGKSAIITGVLPAIFKYRYNKNLHPVSAIEINSREKEILSMWSFCLDDIGAESTFSEYGERKEVFCDIVSEAENRLKPLFISTNLNGVQIAQRYGDRVRSRINRLCRCIVFDSHTRDFRGDS